MLAIVQDSYGSTDALTLREVGRPSIEDDEVLVRVQAAGVDPGVWHLMTGRPYLTRAMGVGWRRPKVAVRGRDLAGVVEAVGPRVTRFRHGDVVYGRCETGSFADYAAARQDRLAAKPADLSFEQAAAIPVSGVTALQAVRDCGRVRAGQNVMVIGAAGGVGSFAVQLAKALGAKVTGVCSATKTDLVRTLGADDVIDYALTEVDSHGAIHDVIIDTAGNRRLSLLRRALTPTGTLVLVGGKDNGDRLLGGFGRQLRAPFVSCWGGNDCAVDREDRTEDLQLLSRFVESGAVRPVLGRGYPRRSPGRSVILSGMRRRGRRHDRLGYNW
jgi:NADPH:quinone reductase-like Zn-dependent oxidoreductase